MFVVVMHAGGRVSVEGLEDLCARSVLAVHGGQMPAYCVVGAADDMPKAQELAKEWRKCRAEGGSLKPDLRN